MNRTKIEWCDYTVNPVKGKCPVGCEYCYMWGKRGIGIRFHFDQRIRYDASAWLGIGSLRKPSRIFVGSTIELFHPRTERYLKYIFLEIEQSLKETPQHTFIFLTKCPQRLPREWPKNCWVGVTATDISMAYSAHAYLQDIEAKVKFLSLEPLLSWKSTNACFPDKVDWLIIGAQTNPYKPPEIEWVRQIVKTGIPVFLKDNLRPLLIPEDCRKPNYLTEDIFWASEKAQLRQEMPEDIKEVK
jgi:protein gp37